MAQCKDEQLKQNGKRMEMWCVLFCTVLVLGCAMMFTRHELMIVSLRTQLQALKQDLSQLSKHQPASVLQNQLPEGKVNNSKQSSSFLLYIHQVLGGASWV